MTLPHVPELLLILVIVMLIFGAGKLPGVAGSMGQAIRDFRKNVQTDDSGSHTSEPTADSSEENRTNSS